MSQMDLFIMRRQKRIKLKQLAAHLNCSIALISLYENDKSQMSYEKVQKYKSFIINY